MAVSVRNRSYSIGALVDIPPGPGAAGVLFSHGGRFGGHALYVKDNRLHYVYNFLGSEQQLIRADEELPTGESLILAASFDKDGENPPGHAHGVLSLYYGDRKVAEGRIHTQAGNSGSAARDSTPDATPANPSPTTIRVPPRGRSPAAP